MPTATRYFVKTYVIQPDGDVAVADNLELPNEEAALYAASVCVFDKAGAAVIAVDGEPAPAERVLHRYGAVPAALGGEPEPGLLDPIGA